jgi:hypothetical protein
MTNEQRITKCYKIIFISILAVLAIFIIIMFPNFLMHMSMGDNPHNWIILESKLKNIKLFSAYYELFCYEFYLEDMVIPALWINFINILLGIKIRTKKLWWFVLFAVNIVVFLFLLGYPTLGWGAE